MPIYENQCMTCLRTANRNADATHRIHRARDARLAEDDVLDGLRLLLLDVLLCDDRLLLGLVLCLFLCSIHLHVNVRSGHFASSLCPIICPCRIGGQGESCQNRVGEHTQRALTLFPRHEILLNTMTDVLRSLGTASCFHSYVSAEDFCESYNFKHIMKIIIVLACVRVL